MSRPTVTRLPSRTAGVVERAGACLCIMAIAVWLLGLPSGVVAGPGYAPDAPQKSHPHRTRSTSTTIARDPMNRLPTIRKGACLLIAVRDDDEDVRVLVQ